MPENHDAVVGDMNSEESEGVCPVVHTRVANHPTLPWTHRPSDRP